MKLHYVKIFRKKMYKTRAGHRFKVDPTLVSDGVKHIEGFLGSLTTLFVPKNKIDPLVEVHTHPFTLQCGSV